MFYLTTYSTHFIYGYIVKEGKILFNNALNTFSFTMILSRNEGNVLFNDVLDTFYLRIYV